MVTDRGVWRRWMVRLLLGLFWAGVVLGGLVNTGYSHVADHVSNLASFGASHAWVGIAAIASFGLADLVGAQILAVGRRAATWALSVAGVASLAIAAARIHCPGGAAGCAGGAGSETWTDLAHTGAVAINALAFAVAILVVAADESRAGQRGRAVLLVAGVVLSFACLLISLGDAALGAETVGAWQRGWLLLNTVLLLAVTRSPGVGPTGGRPSTTRAGTVAG